MNFANAVNVALQEPEETGVEAVLLRLCARLRQVLEQENDDLRNAETARLAEHARQKDLLQLDIRRLLERHGQPELLQDHLREDLLALKAVLDENARLLDLHLKAAREFVGHVEESIRRHNSDGTYSPSMLGGAGGMRGYGAW